MRSTRALLLALVCAAACGDVKPTFVDSPGGNIDADVGVDAPLPIDAPAMVTLTLIKTGNGAVTSTPGSINCGSTCTTSVPAGTVITLTATPDVGNNFSSWGGGCTGSVGICSFTINTDTTVNANFAVAMYTLTVAVGGNGTGSVTSSPAGINCPGACTTQVPYNQTVTLTATPGGSSQFLGWAGGNCTGTGTCAVTVTGDTTVNASFGLQYSVVVTKTGTGAASGAVTSSPIGINCGSDCSEVYSAGTMVTLTETVGPDAQFSGWGGACSAQGTNPTCTVTVNAAITVNAAFALRTFVLTAATNGTGTGTITSSPSGVTCGNGNTACSATYNYGQVVTLTATQSATSSFAGWSGACSGLTNPCMVTMDQARSVTATFNVNSYTLSVAKSGTGMTAGTVTSNPGTINCGTTCSNSYTSGTVVTLTATPGTGNNFNGWSGAPGCTTATTCQVTMNAAVNVTAMFTLSQFTVTVTKAGAQASLGTVTGNPGPISCGTTCSGTYDYGTSLTLSTSVGTNTVFGGWSGGSCTGTSPCTFSVTANVTITATFNVGSYDTTILSSPPSTTSSTTATFTFDSVPAGAGTFQCAFDEDPFTSCTSPITISALGSTYHRFRVAAGSPPDPTPASYSWFITGSTQPRLPDSFTATCTDGSAFVTCPAGVAGQDGFYRINVPVYTVSSNGLMVTDSITGLQWERNISSTSTEAGAISYCSTLNLGGVTGWRLPTRFELNTLIDAGRVGPPFEITAFPGIPSNSFMRTSTPVLGGPNFYAYNTNYSVEYAWPGTDTQPVRCVRGFMGGGTLINYSANTVFDGRTNLYWQKTANATSTWQAAITTCENLTADGFTDWRLPSQKELESVVDDNTSNPSISTLFTDRPATTFWTSTVVANTPTGAYAINFNNGLNANIENVFSTLYQSRCVR